MTASTLNHKKPYVDQSIFQGWLEFYTENEELVRAENKGGKIFNYYIYKDGGFIFEGKYKHLGKFTPNNVYKAYEHAQGY